MNTSSEAFSPNSSTQAEKRAEMLVDAGIFTPAVARLVSGDQVNEDSTWSDISSRLSHPSTGMSPAVFQSSRKSRNPGTDRDFESLPDSSEVLGKTPLPLSQQITIEKDLLQARLDWSISLKKAGGNEESARSYANRNTFVAKGNR